MSDTPIPTIEQPEDFDVVLNAGSFAPSDGIAAENVAPFNPANLDAGFWTKVQAVIAACAARGVKMQPYFGVRDPWVQARFWRQSRSRAECDAAIADLEAKGAPYLAKVMRDVGPQPDGPKITGALPGFSWHQWGEAVDAFWNVGGAAEWSTTKLVNGVNGYHVWAAQARDAGLNAGGFWNSLKDWPHLQLRGAASPKSQFTVPQIDAAMKAKFGDAETPMG